MSRKVDPGVLYTGTYEGRVALLRYDVHSMSYKSIEVYTNLDNKGFRFYTREGANNIHPVVGKLYANCVFIEKLAFPGPMGLSHCEICRGIDLYEDSIYCDWVGYLRCRDCGHNNYKNR